MLTFSEQVAAQAGHNDPALAGASVGRGDILDAHQI